MDSSADCWLDALFFMFSRLGGMRGSRSLRRKAHHVGRLWKEPERAYRSTIQIGVHIRLQKLRTFPGADLQGSVAYRGAVPHNNSAADYLAMTNPLMWRSACGYHRLTCRTCRQACQSAVRVWREAAVANRSTRHTERQASSGVARICVAIPRFAACTLLYYSK